MTYTPLWPRNARNGRITLHRDQYPATVSFNTVSTTERNQTSRTPWPESDVLVCCSCRLALIVEQHSKIPIVPESRTTIDFILMPGKKWRSSIILLLATSGSWFELHVGPR